MKYFICLLLLCLSACSPRPAFEAVDRRFLMPEISGEGENTISEEDSKLTETIETIEAIETMEKIPETAPVFLSREEELEYQTEQLLGQMSVEIKIWQLFICRLPAGTTRTGEKLEEWMEKHPSGGFILFGENVESIEQVENLTEGMQFLSKIPLLIAIDEEGGRISRIGKLYADKIPSAYHIGQTKDLDKAFQAGFTIAGRLTSFGINMNFAPVADIWSNDKNTVIGDRAFGKDPLAAADMMEANLQGLREGGVLAVIKHFPGHGDTAEDSHARLAYYHYDKERFDHFESIPFKRGIAAGADGVMIGHIATPQLKNDKPVMEWMAPWLEDGRLPATFSDYWMEDVLRGEMGYEGLIITDGLEMGALTKNFTQEQIVLGAFMAGADILLIPQNPAKAFESLLEAYNQGLFDDERLDASVKRIIKTKIKAGLF